MLHTKGARILVCTTDNDNVAIYNDDGFSQSLLVEWGN